MDKKEYLEDLAEIKDIMNRSSRFISLSGLSGVSAGIVALLGAATAYQYLYTYSPNYGFKILGTQYGTIPNLILIGTSTLILALAFGIYFTTKKAKSQNQKIWDFQTKRLLINLAIPLFTGGILCLILLAKSYVGFVAPFTLVFYGLALINASKYTFKEIRSLGLIEIALGLIASYYIGYGLLFWAIGFGLLHIFYGLLMQVKYK